MWLLGIELRTTHSLHTALHLYTALHTELHTCVCSRPVLCSWVESHPHGGEHKMRPCSRHGRRTQRSTHGTEGLRAAPKPSILMISKGGKFSPPKPRSRSGHKCTHVCRHRINIQHVDTTRTRHTSGKHLEQNKHPQATPLLRGPHHGHGC